MTTSFQRAAEWFLRIALSAAFFSAVADRFGLWGTHDTPGVSWGDWQHFLVYSAKLNAWLPSALHAPAAWIATIAEVVFGLALLIPCGTRPVAAASGLLLAIFALAMTLFLGPKAPLDYSVWTAAAGAFLLASTTKTARESRE